MVHPQIYTDWQEEVRDRLSKFHREFPLRVGMVKEELRSRKFGFFSVKLFNALLKEWEEAGVISVIGQNLASAGYKPQLSPRYEQLIAQLLQKYQDAGMQPPLWSEAASALTDNESEQMSF